MNSVPSFDTASSPSLNIVGAIQQGLLVSNSSFLPRPTYTCPAANCTWPSFTSLAVCSRCANVSSHVQTFYFPQVSWTTTIGSSFFGPPGISYNITSGSTVSLLNQIGLAFDAEKEQYGVMIDVLSARWAANPNETLSFRDSQTLLSSFLMLYSNPSYASNKTAWESTPINAIECGLLLCTNLYQSSVANNALSENITSTASVRVSTSYQPISRCSDTSLPSLAANIPGCTILADTYANQSGPAAENDSWIPAYQQKPIPRTDFSLEAPLGMHGIFNISQAAIDSVASYLGSLLDSGLYLSHRLSLSSDGLQRGSNQMRALYAACSSPNSSPSYSPEPIFSNIAYAMTTAFRNAGNQSTFQTGSTQEWTIYIQIRWGAISVPVLVTTFGVIFLAISIWRTRRAGLAQPWKDNPLPGLLAGLEGEQRRRMKSKLEEQDWKKDRLEEACKNLKVRLRDGTRPVLRAESEVLRSDGFP